VSSANNTEQDNVSVSKPAVTTPLRKPAISAQTQLHIDPNMSVSPTLPDQPLPTTKPTSAASGISVPKAQPPPSQAEYEKMSGAGDANSTPRTSRQAQSDIVVDDDDLQRMWSKKQLERLHWEFERHRKAKGKRMGSFGE
jgi:hypothetical protein